MRIANLPDTKTLTPADTLIVSDGQLTKKITVGDFKTSLVTRASKTEYGVIRVGNGLDVSDTGVLSVKNYNAYTLPPATNSALGGVMVGHGLAIDSYGFLSTTYELPIAGPDTLGGVRVGTGFVIASDGTISIDSTNRNVFNTGVSVGDNDAILSVIANVPTLSSLKSRLRVSVKGITATSALTIIAAEESAALTGPNVPAIVPETTFNLGIPAKKWNEVYADKFVGAMFGEVFGDVVGNVTGNLVSEAGVTAYNSLTGQFTGSFTGDLTGVAASANKLEAFRTINGIAFDGTSDITITDDTKLPLTGGALTGYLSLNGSPVLELHAATKKYVDQSVNSKLALIGGTMIGFLTLSDAPQAPLHAATKEYVDGSVATKLSTSGGVISGSLSVLAAPTNLDDVTNLRYVNSTITNKITENNTSLMSYIDYKDSFKLSIMGGNLTGFLTLHDDPQASHHAATKSYVDSQILTQHVYTDSRFNELKDYADAQDSYNRDLIKTEIKNTATSIKQYVDDTAAGKLSIAGGTMLGSISLTMPPSENNHVVHKQYVDGSIASAVSSSATFLTQVMTQKDAAFLAKSGGSMTGALTLQSNPTVPLHAATKQYVDSVVAEAIKQTWTVTYGNTNYSTAGFSNWVGNWSNDYNWFDVYPPAGKSMANLIAFIPSIAVIHFGGGVDGNDSIRCTWTPLSNRIRVYVQNTEQRSTPAANWLAIWS